VGYAGGQAKNPTYKSIMDHTEVISLEFDPRAVSYETLCTEFYNFHSPTFARSTQYRSVILWATIAQKEIAERVTKEVVQKLGRQMHTKIEPLGEYYLGEDYHQKFSFQKFH
jgi:peptide-methionine (S)-S-oxide reductase